MNFFSFPFTSLLFTLLFFYHNITFSLFLFFCESLEKNTIHYLLFFCMIRSLITIHFSIFLFISDVLFKIDQRREYIYRKCFLLYVTFFFFFLSLEKLAFYIFLKNVTYTAVQARRSRGGWGGFSPPHIFCQS